MGHLEHDPQWATKHLFLKVAMFGIKLKGLRKSGRFNDLNEAYFIPNLHPTLGWGHKPVFIAIFSIKSNILMGPLRKYHFIVFSKWVIPNPDIIIVLPFKRI